MALFRLAVSYLESQSHTVGRLHVWDHLPRGQAPRSFQGLVSTLLPQLSSDLRKPNDTFPRHQHRSTHPQRPQRHGAERRKANSRNSLQPPEPLPIRHQPGPKPAPSLPSLCVATLQICDLTRALTAAMCGTRAVFARPPGSLQSSAHFLLKYMGSV